MKGPIARSFAVGAASLSVAILLAGLALADGLPTRDKTRGDIHDHPCSVSGSVGLATDYVYRGFSLTRSNPAVQASVDLTCGRFYLGAFTSNIDLGLEGTLKVDVYGGYKFSTGRSTGMPA
jgi:uncharacterized protein (TIGR02001 family)